MRRYTGFDCLAALSMALGLGVVLGIGPHTQYYLVSLARSSEASIYASAYSNSLVSFSGALPWVSSLIDFNLFLCAFFVAGVALFLNKARDIFAVSAVVIFLLLTLVDYYYSLAPPSTACCSRMSENLIGNLIGAPVIAGYSVMMLWAMRAVVIGVGGHKFFTRLLVISLPLLSALIIAISAFLVATLFFNLTPATISAAIKPDVSGWFWVDKNKGEEKKFGLFQSGEAVDGVLSVVHVTKPLGVEWESKRVSVPAKIKLSILHGCHPDQLDDLELDQAKTLEVDGVKKIEVSAGAGQNYLELPINSGEISVSPADNNPYWFNKHEKEKGKGKTHNELVLLSEDRQVDIGSSRPKNSMYLYASLMDDKGKKARHYNISFGDGSVGVIARYAANANLESVKECSQMDALLIDRKNNFYVMDSVGYFGIYIQIEQAPEMEMYFDGFSSFSVKGVNGWVYVNELSDEDVGKVVKAGKLENLQFRGNVGYLEIDGVQVKAKINETFNLLKGDMDGKVEDGVLYVAGTSNGVYKDKKLQNKTRWERMPLEVQIGLFTLFCALVAWVLRLLYGCLRNNESIGFRSWPA